MQSSSRILPFKQSLAGASPATDAMRSQGVRVLHLSLRRRGFVVQVHVRAPAFLPRNEAMLRPKLSSQSGNRWQELLRMEPAGLPAARRGHQSSHAALALGAPCPAKESGHRCARDKPASRLAEKPRPQASLWPAPVLPWRDADRAKPLSAKHIPSSAGELLPGFHRRLDTQARALPRERRIAPEADHTPARNDLRSGNRC